MLVRTSGQGQGDEQLITEAIELWTPLDDSENVLIGADEIRPIEPATMQRQLEPSQRL